MREIPLTKGFVALVDDEDYHWLSKFKWCYSGNGYPVSRKASGIGKVVCMHTVIMDTWDGTQVDHIDGNKMNNTRANLRYCTGSGNSKNKSKKKNGKSPFKGIYLHKYGRWHASIMVDRKKISLGYYDTPEEAAQAYDAGARLFHGPYAKTNF